MLPIAEKIRTLRKERGITQDELASALRVSFQSVSRWENGETYPDIEMIPKIAAYFGVTTDELLVEKDESVLKEEREKKRSEFYNAIWSEKDPSKKCDLALRAFREFPDDYRFAADALAAITEIPPPGKVILEVEANSKTMSGLPASRQRERISGNGTKSPSNSWTQ